MLLVSSLRSRLRPPSAGAGAAVSAFSTSAAAMEAEQMINKGPRNNWSKDEIKAVYDSPVLDLLFHGAQVHRAAQNFTVVQQYTLLSIKTGGCSEDCSYCPQSSRYDICLKAQRLMNKDVVIETAKKANRNQISQVDHAQHGILSFQNLNWQQILHELKGKHGSIHRRYQEYCSANTILRAGT